MLLLLLLLLLLLGWSAWELATDLLIHVAASLSLCFQLFRSAHPASPDITAPRSDACTSWQQA